MSENRGYKNEVLYLDRLCITIDTSILKMTGIPYKQYYIVLKAPTTYCIVWNEQNHMAPYLCNILATGQGGISESMEVH